MIDTILTGSGLLAAGMYVLRINAIRAGRHLPRCIAVQVAGLLVALWIMGSTPGAAWWLLAANVLVLVALATHILWTAHLWVHGAPREAEAETGSPQQTQAAITPRA